MNYVNYNVALSVFCRKTVFFTCHFYLSLLYYRCPLKLFIAKEMTFNR